MPNSKYENKQVKVSSIGLKEAFQNVMNWLYTGSVWVRQKAEATGEASNVNYGKQTGGTITAFRTESTGEQTTSVHGDAAGTITSLKVETTGEADVVLHGKDSSSNIDPLRTNDNQQLQVEVIGVGSGTWIQQDPTELITSSQTLFDPGSDSTEEYLVSFNVVNIDDANYYPATVSIGVDIGGNGGNLADKEFWMMQQVVGYPGSSGWQGPYLIAGDDNVIGLATANNSATVHIRARRVNE
jgi:hypothetical protein